MEVLVTNTWNRLGYNICRSLGIKGLEICAGSDLPIGMGPLSKYVKKSFLHPPICKDNFLRIINKALTKYKPKVLIPSDEDLFIFSKNLDVLQQFSTIIPISDYEIIDTLNKKNKSIAFVKSLGLPTPITFEASSEGDVRHFIKEIGEPVVLKTIESSGARGVFFLNKSNILQKVEQLFEDNRIGWDDLILQQYVNGSGYGVSMLFNQGNLRAKFTHKRNRERFSTGGPSTIRTSTKNGLLEEYAVEILTKIKYHGVGMIEFKYNEETGQCWFIEANPRFWGSLGLAIQSGVDFPFLLYQMAINGDISPVLDYKIGTTTKWLFGDILAVIAQIKKSRDISKMSQFFIKNNGL